MRLDMAAINLGQLADASEIMEASITEALQDWRREKAIVTLAYVIIRETDPSFTIDDARKLRMSDLEVVNADPEVTARGNGNEPQPSRVSGG